MPQSIREKNIENYQKEFEDKLLSFGKSENIYHRFMVGKRQDKDKSLHTLMMHEKLCPLNCEMVEYIRDKIAGRLNERSMKKNKPLSYFIKVSAGAEDEYIFDWNEIEW